MAASTAFTTYDVGGQREDLMDVITRVSPEDTPMFSMFGRTKASARKVEWMTESLATPAANAQPEGATYSYSKPTARTRSSNNCQIFSKTFSVTETQEAVDSAGIRSEYAHRMELALKEMGRDIEYAFVNGTGNTGSDDTTSGARYLKGVGSWITTNVETGSGTGTQALTETLFNDLMQTVAAAGGKPDTVFVNGFQKRQISAFTTNTRNVEASSKTLYRPIDVYYSDFGKVNVYYDDLLPTDECWVLQRDKWQTAVLRPVAQVDNLAKTGSFMPGAVEGELTLIALNEKASGKITELTTS